MKMAIKLLRACMRACDKYDNAYDAVVIAQDIVQAP